MLQQTLLRGNLEELRVAIDKAEAHGLETTPARKRYSELAKSERQSPDRAQEMLRWAMSMQDGVMLYSVINEVQQMAPDSRQLPEARLKLADHQDEAKLRLQRLAKNRNGRELSYMLDRARHMGIPASELHWVEHHLRVLEEAPLSTRAAVALPVTVVTKSDARPMVPATGDSQDAH